jgi:hypothetical protein
MKPWLKLGSVAMTLALLTACSSDVRQEMTDAPALTTQAGQTFAIRFSEDDAEQRHDNGKTHVLQRYSELNKGVLVAKLMCEKEPEPAHKQFT